MKERFRGYYEENICVMHLFAECVPFSGHCGVRQVYGLISPL